MSSFHFPLFPGNIIVGFQTGYVGLWKPGFEFIGSKCLCQGALTHLELTPQYVWFSEELGDGKWRIGRSQRQDVRKVREGQARPTTSGQGKSDQGKGASTSPTGQSK